jgi:hypothetical protein
MILAGARTLASRFRQRPISLLIHPRMAIAYAR